MSRQRSGEPPRRGALFAGALVGIFCAGMAVWGSNSSLLGPAEFQPRELNGGVFYVPLAGARDKAVIQLAKNRKVKINRPFFDKYHAPLVSAVRSFAHERALSLRDQVNLFGWLVIQTHNANQIGYLWGGDLEDGPSAAGSASGVGYDCSGYFWSVWESIEPRSVFANDGVRLDSRSYLKLGRQVFPRANVDEAFIERLEALAVPGDALIDPNGHIALYGYDPRGAERRPIVMENGEFWNDLDKWLVRNRGKRYEVRSAFDEQGNLMTGKGWTPGRTIQPLPAPEPAIVASVAPSSPEKVKPTPPEPQPSRDEKDEEELQQIERQVASQLRRMKAFDIANLPPPRALGRPALAGPKSSNHKPSIVAVRAPAERLYADALQFGLLTEDADDDPIVQYRVRLRGSKRWLRCDRPHFKTSIPGFSGQAVLEFQVVDARGGVSPSVFCKIGIVAR
jgi:hypothetical protein